MRRGGSCWADCRWRGSRLRAWLDARESRLATVALGVAFVAYGVAVASYLGVGAALAPRSEVMMTAGATLVGHWMLLVGVVSYGRFVVLDAQGLILRSERAVSRQVDGSKVKSTVKDQGVNHVASRFAADGNRGPLRAFRESPEGSANGQAKPTEWVDGSEPEAEAYDEGDGNSRSHGGRRLSKAERKRLRNQKRAA